MSHRIAVLSAVLLLIAAMLCGCALAAPVPTPTPVPTAIPTAEPTPSPSPTPSPTPSPIPTPTPEPTATPIPDWFPTDTPKEDGLYKIVVYFGTQSVVVYRAENGAWVQHRVMACSSGKTTPEGTFAVYTKYRYHSLFGARGQYCSRITGHFLFHSVPIDENARKVDTGKMRMKLEEYEKLGTPASDGCIRLTCIDAKWIHDNCDRSTVVVMTAENGPEAPTPPALIAGEPYEVEPGYGWDPTDPDPENPYHAVYGVPEETMPAAEKTETEAEEDEA